MRGQTGPTAGSVAGTIEWVRLISDEHELLLPEMKKRPRTGIQGAQVEDEKKAHEGLTGRYGYG